jgi:hypothetical protein
LQAGGSEFESLKLHQTADELEKPSPKCGGFSVSYSEVTAIAPNKSLFRSSVVPAGNTYRRYPQAPLFILMIETNYSLKKYLRNSNVLLFNMEIYFSLTALFVAKIDKHGLVMKNPVYGTGMFG